MKILYILPSLRNQGPIVVVKNLTDYMVKWGHEVVVFYFDEFEPMPFKCPTKRISIKEPIDFDYFDIVHSHCFRPDIYVARWKNKIHKAKIVTTLHQDTYQSFHYKYNAFLSWIFTKYWCSKQSKFDGVISISEQLKNAYKSKISVPITTVYNGCSINIVGNIDTNVLERIIRLREDYKILGTYAFVTRRKGLEQIIHVLPRLKDYAFIIIGEGPDIINLKSLAIQLNVSNRVLFLPYQKNPYKFLPYFDVYVMPSYSEGFGLAMVEAALAEKSIVCSNIPTFHEIFNENEASFFNLDDIDSLYNAITRAIDGKLNYGMLAYKRANENFTAQKMTENYLKFYQKIMVTLK